MAAGFLYVLLNCSYPDQVKLGRTEGDPEERAKRLRTTGVPTPFIVVYDEVVSDCEAAERDLHRRFSSYRVSQDREFFRIPVREAVRAMQEVVLRYPLEGEQRLGLLHQLQIKYGAYLRPEITDVAIVQVDGFCYLEISRGAGFEGRDEIIERMDLSFIFDSNPVQPRPIFTGERLIEANAYLFLTELGGRDLAFATDLFTEDAVEMWERSSPEDED